MQHASAARHKGKLRANNTFFYLVLKSDMSYIVRWRTLIYSNQIRAQVELA